SNDAARDYYARLGQLANLGAGATEVIVFDEQASGLASTASYLFDERGELLTQLRGSLEAGSPPTAVREAVEPLANRPRPAARQGLAILPVLPRTRLLIVGGGHVGQAVGAMAADLDF